MASHDAQNPGSTHLDWWKGKLSRMQDRTFVMPRWGPRILDVLLGRDNGKVEAHSLPALARELGVPLKFVSRAIASVTRLGIVTAQLRPPTISVVIHPDRFARRKISLRRPRRRVSKTDRELLKEQSDYRCACCGRKFRSRELVIDHLIPLSLLGADEPENWVVMSKKHNGMKWDRLLCGDLQFYRKEKVRKRFGVRFMDGVFWPVINGKIRYSRRLTDNRPAALTRLHPTAAPQRPS